MIKQYKVAGHYYRVIFKDGGINDERLIKSSEPFETEVTDVPLLFELYVDDSFKKDPLSFLDELSHGMKVGGEIDRGGIDAFQFLAKNSAAAHLPELFGNLPCQAHRSSAAAVQTGYHAHTDQRTTGRFHIAHAQTKAGCQLIKLFFGQCRLIGQCCRRSLTAIITLLSEHGRFLYISIDIHSGSLLFCYDGRLTDYGFLFLSDLSFRRKLK